ALAVGVHAVAHVERVLHGGRNAFRPLPDVDSTVVRMLPLAPPPLDQPFEAALRSLTRIAFGQRRKQFQRILRDALQLTPGDVATLSRTTGFDLSARPETFAPSDFIRLARTLKESLPPPPGGTA